MPTVCLTGSLPYAGSSVRPMSRRSFSGSPLSHNRRAKISLLTTTPGAEALSRSVTVGLAATVCEGFRNNPAKRKSSPHLHETARPASGLGYSAATAAWSPAEGSRTGSSFPHPAMRRSFIKRLSATDICIVSTLRESRPGCTASNECECDFGRNQEGAHARLSNLATGLVFALLPCHVEVSARNA